MLVFASALAFAAFGCGDGGIGDAEDPNFDTDPETLTFTGVDLEEEATEVVEIKNTGAGVLVLDDFRLESNDGPVFEKVGDWPSEERLSEDQTLELAVSYQRPNAGTHRGEIRMNNNDSSISGDAVVDIEAPAIDPEIYVHPSPVDFPQTPAGSVESRHVQVENVGSGVLDIENIEVTSGQSEFSVSFFEMTDDGSPPAREDDEQYPERTEFRSDDEPLHMRVTFEPETDDPTSGEITIEYNGGQQEVVPLSGNSGEECLEVSDEEIDFGPASLSGTTFHTLTLHNCSPDADGDVTLEDIRVTDDDGGVFTVDETELPGSLPGEPAVLESGETVTVLVGYAPTDEVDNHGELLVANDAASGDYRIPLSGVGVDAECPTAVAQGGVGPVFEDPVAATNQDTVQLTAADSYDHPDNDGSSDLEYEWALINKPDGSTTSIEPSDTVDTEMDVDIVGNFEIELTVTNEYGLTNCDPEILEVHAVPTEDIHIQLVWSAPEVDENYGGPDPSSFIGTDLDIHYVHTDDDQVWGSSESIYYAQTYQDWGEHGEAQLDIDDLYGADPENINHSDPMPGGAYRVGVHYYCDNGYGPADATVRVYFGDTLVFEEEERLNATDHFWEPGIIHWAADPAERNVQPIDNYQESLPALHDCNPSF